MRGISEANLAVIDRADTASAALHPKRRALLAALAEPESAAGLSRRFGLPRQRLNYHLRALERHGLIECVEERKKGNCTERLLRATARSFVIAPQALGALGATPQAAQDRFSASYAIAVAARTVQEVSTLEQAARAAKKRIATLTIDAEVRFATAERRAAFAEELSGTIARLVAKYHDDEAHGGRRFRLSALVHPMPQLHTKDSQGADR
ncbi:MAG TPA: helix-turn-helix domain-containing protein [Vicinamibacterales bacterium]|jgi:DNA-binding transcriptional ArsR family regulator